MTYRCIFSICCCTLGQQAHAAEPLVMVDVKLVREELYTGECPYLRVLLTASGKRTAQIVTWQHLVNARLQCELIGPNGPTLKSPVTTIGIGLPRAVEHVPLYPGKTLDYDMIPVFCRPSLPGDYSLKCSLRPLSDDSEFVVKKEMKIRYVDVPAERIKDKVSFQVPIQRGVPNPFRGKVELINAKSGDGYELLYRTTQDTDGGERHFLRRVLQLEEASRLVAIPRFFESPDFKQEVWVAYNKGDEAYIARLNFTTGSLLEVMNMTQAFEQFKKSKD